MHSQLTIKYRRAMAFRQILFCFIYFLLFQQIQEFLFDIPDGQSIAFIGGLIRGIGARKQFNRLNDEFNNFNVSREMDRYLAQRGELDVDRSGFDEFRAALESQVGTARSDAERARFEKISAGATPQGDAQARRSVQETTANILDNAQDSISDARGLAAVLGFATQQENNQMNQIDQQSAARVEANEANAENVLSAAQGRRLQSEANLAAGIGSIAESNRDLDILEYEQNQLNPFLQAISDKRSLRAGRDQAKAVELESYAGFADGLFNVGLTAASGGFSGFGGGGLSGFV